MLFALGALSSYWLFAIGWVAFGVASLRARVFPVWISIFIVVGGIAGYQALLAPWGIPLGLAIATLGVWLLRRPRSSATTESLDERAAIAVV
jgi:mannose/fructose/N-acetylgalactosamine-specific phosphotransferase system component IIC